MEKPTSIENRADFMEFFRNDGKLSLLTADDRAEIFSSILIGSSDFTKQRLEDLLNDYGVSHLVVTERKDKKS